MIKRFTMFLLVFAALTACKNDDDGPSIDPGSDQAINNWIYDIMDEVYYWTDEIPDNVNKSQNPSDYFYSLLSDKDRFSIILPDYQELINSINGISLEAGYEFVLVQREGTDEVVVVILYVKKGSPADLANLKRGDVIEKVNGSTLTLNNYQTIAGGIYDDHQIDFLRWNVGLEEYESMQAQLQVVQVSENPNFLDSVYTAQNGKKVGYFVYNFFSGGGSNQYNDQMDAVFARLQSEAIDELVLDLRYNSGGSVSAATNLASLIAPGISSENVFYQYQWNDLYQDYYENQPDGDDILRGKFVEKMENIGSLLSNNRIYVLVGSRTASASELIINGLSPYVDVIIIGETTVGKNVGSVPIEDTENELNNYGLLPIVFKIFNSAGQSFYSNGFTPGPEFLGEDLEFPLKQLGDMEESLLQIAINDIEEQQSGRTGADIREITPKLMFSHDLKPYRNNLFMEDLPDNRE